MTRNKKKARISTKWKNYTFYGELIKNTRLICAKTPITQYKHTPELLVQSINNDHRRHKVGLVIDLTDTTKYYNSQEFIALNVVYYKINCKGMKIPSEETVEHFKDIIIKYFKEHEKNNKSICIHCFNGVNCSGYMICRYLIDVLKYTPIAAIHVFQDARGYSIEHDYLRDDLLKRQPRVENEGKTKCMIM